MTSRTSSASFSYGGLVTEGLSREFTWGCELTKDKSTVLWEVQLQETDSDKDNLRHMLFLKQAVLGASVAKNEKHIVTLETHNYYKDTVKLPIVSLTAGINDMCLLDLNFAADVPLRFTLTSGTGPLYLIGSHLVECAQNSGDFDSCEYDIDGHDTADADEDPDIAGTEIKELSDQATKQLDQETISVSVPRKLHKTSLDNEQLNAKAAKRKAAGAEKHSAKKRGKFDSTANDDNIRYQLVEQNDDSEEHETGSSDEDGESDDIEEKADGKTGKTEINKGTDEDSSSDDGSSSDESDEDEEETVISPKLIGKKKANVLEQRTKSSSDGTSFLKASDRQHKLTSKRSESKTETLKSMRHQAKSDKRKEKKSK